MARMPLSVVCSERRRDALSRRWIGILLLGAFGCRGTAPTETEASQADVSVEPREDDAAARLRVANAWVASQPGTRGLRAQAIGTCTRERANERCIVRDLLGEGTWVVYQAAGRLGFFFFVEVDASDGGLNARFRRPGIFNAGFQWSMCGCRPAPGLEVREEYDGRER